MGQNFVIIGPQASGKGTQAELIAQRYKVDHLSIGELFRKEVSTGSKLGKQLASYMNRGVLVPPELNNAFVEKVLSEHSSGAVLDGYPRTREQAEFLDDHWSVDCVIVLRVPDKVCIDRISGRRVCDNGHEYHVLFSPPKKVGVCDHDGLPLRMRSDDTPNSVKKRLATYHARTEPVIAYYRNKGVLVLDVDGTGNIQEVRDLVAQELKKYLN